MLAKALLNARRLRSANGELLNIVGTAFALLQRYSYYTFYFICQKQLIV